MYYTIYETTNLINGKKYRGKHKTNHLDDGYLGSGKYLKRAIDKYGAHNFSKEILVFADSEDEMNWLEANVYVTEEWMLSKNSYNLKVGGTGGFQKNKVTTLGGGYMDSADFATSNEVGVAFGKIPVFINDSNDIVQIDKNDYDPNTMVPCMNKNGNMSVIENSTGKLIRIMNCEYDTAIHTHPTKNKCTMKSVKTGEIVSLDVSDERVVSGEFVGVTAGQSSVAYNYTFFDETGSIKFVHNSKFGSIGEFMIANNLPVGPFSKSYQRGGAPIFQKVGSNMTRLIESGNIKYKGWYCKQEKHDA